MITRIEALNFRCLRYVSQSLERFHVLVGPNASGKTTFLDVVAFLGQIVAEGLDAAVGERTQNFEDLLWQRSGTAFELAIEAAIPNELRANLADPRWDTVRYQIGLQMVPLAREVAIQGEMVTLRAGMSRQPRGHHVFPDQQTPPWSLFEYERKDERTVLVKTPSESTFWPESIPAVEQEQSLAQFKLGPRRSALGNLPEDEIMFPVATWLKSLLTNGIQRLMLNSLLLRKASPPGRGRAFLPDGSNLPWVVADLERNHAERIGQWVAHLQTALPDLEGIRTVERPDDRHRYLMLRYRGGLEVPSWMASDGTLRLLALTLPAYLPELSGVYLIEEPENGIHPRAIETMFQSLTSVYDAQILLATHSPVVLSVAEPKDLLCFAKAENGATDIVLGSEHPALADWRGQENLSVLFAAGVLG
jgi:predicted ATPase